MREIEIAPSILAADFADLKSELLMLEKSVAKRIHLDVMDGHFVPNISFGPPVIQAINKKTKLFLEAHLMISEPLKYLQAFKDAGSDIIIVHYEALKDPLFAIKEIKKMGIQAGISINPATAWEKIKELLAEVDMVLIMSVNPGFGGQKYIAEASNKMQKMFEYIKKNKLKTDIGIDGGIDLTTIEDAVSKGANIIIAGSSVFKAENPIKMIADLKKIAEEVKSV